MVYDIVCQWHCVHQLIVYVNASLLWHGHGNTEIADLEPPRRRYEQVR